MHAGVLLVFSTLRGRIRCLRSGATHSGQLFSPQLIKSRSQDLPRGSFPRWFWLWFTVNSNHHRYMLWAPLLLIPTHLKHTVTAIAMIFSFLLCQNAWKKKSICNKEKYSGSQFQPVVVWFSRFYTCVEAAHRDRSTWWQGLFALWWTRDRDGGRREMGRGNSILGSQLTL